MHFHFVFNLVALERYIAHISFFFPVEDSYNNTDMLTTAPVVLLKVGGLSQYVP